MRYCVRCFTRGHEEEHCPKAIKRNDDEPSRRTQKERDMAKFLKAKEAEPKVIEEVEIEPRDNKFMKFKRKAPEIEQPKKRQKVESDNSESDADSEPKLTISREPEKIEEKPTP